MKKARKKITTTTDKRMFSVFHLSLAIFRYSRSGGSSGGSRVRSGEMSGSGSSRVRSGDSSGSTFHC